MFYFYDTCALLNLQEQIFEEGFFAISIITLKEIENIKTSIHKDEEVKYKARKILHALDKNQEKFKVIIYNPEWDEKILEKKIPLTDDSRIIYSAYMCENNPIFWTDDLSCKTIAAAIGLKVNYIPPKIESYKGYKEINLTEEELALFYNITLIKNSNKYELLDNEYLVIKMNNVIVDKFKWHDNRYSQLGYLKFSSDTFDKVSPKDTFQMLAMDSLCNNKITALRGPAGTGKSYLAFGYMFSLLERGKIDKIIVFCNTVATKGSAKLGFYPGTKDEKLLDSQIGNFLTSKLGGDRYFVEQLMRDQKLLLLPMSDIRGYDTSGMNAAIYITEAQNLDIDLMKLALQRIGEDSICILDGDDEAQVDMTMYAGANNGLKRMVEVFKGQPFFGTVELQIIHRSKIAEIAQLM